MKLNSEWHQANKMPKHATLDQRIEWHLEHMKNCQCRTTLPEKIKTEMQRRDLL